MTRLSPDTQTRHAFPDAPGASRRTPHLRGILLLLLLGALASFTLGCPVEEEIADMDGDGIADADDACPRTTPLGAPLFQQGCALTDFIVEPEALTEAIEARMDEIAAPLADEPMLAEAALGLADAAMHFEAARDAFRQLDPCQGAASFGNAQAALLLGSDAFTVFLQEMLAVSDATEKPDGDVDELSSLYLWWLAREHEYDAVLGETAMAAETANEVCQAIAGSEVLEGRVDFTNPAKRTFHTERGLPVVMGPYALFDASLAPGVNVSADVLRFFDDTLVTGGGSVSWDSVTQLPGIWDGACLELRIMPWGVTQPGLGHTIGGYIDTQGVVQLEQGMQIGAIGPLCPQKSDLVPYTRYGFRVTLLLNGGFQKVELASGLLAGGDVHLPSYISPAVQTDLKIEKLRWTCQKDPLSIVGAHKCANETLINTTVHPVQIHGKFNFCDAIYNKTVFSLPPNNALAYEPAMVVGMNGTSSLGPVAFHARARKIVNGAPGSIQDIGRYQPFAVFRSDAGLSPHGTNQSSAIQWPYITGFRNNLPFRYACSVPKLIRDRISYCSGVADTYYRLPFHNGQSTFVGQGNDTPYSGSDPTQAPTHWSGGWQRYALDLLNPTGTDLVAARDGIVQDVVSNLTIRCGKDSNGNTVTIPGGLPCPNPSGFFGNYVVLRHADGDWTWYMHMDTGSATAANIFVGKTVKRGDKIGEVGLTGNTTDDHVHFHVTPGNVGMTTQQTYQFYTDPNLSNLVSCQVPQAGLTYWSNNAP